MVRRREDLGGDGHAGTSRDSIEPMPASKSRSTSFERWQEHARELQRSSRAASTERGYASDWRDFTEWCQAEELTPVPATPETVATYLAAMEEAGARPATLRRRLSGIAAGHERAGVTSPTSAELVRRTMSNIRRELGSASQGKAAILTEDIAAMVAAIPLSSNRGLQERAVLLLGFAGGFRRSELVALNLGDITELPDGLRVTIRRSKTDQEGRGRVLGIPRGVDPRLCPVRAVEEWRRAGLESSSGEQEPLFHSISRYDDVQPSRLSDRGVARTVQRAARRAGLDSHDYAGHSLRSGLVTSAKRGGATDQSVMRQTGHRKREMIDRYTREVDLFIDNAARRAGL